MSSNYKPGEKAMEGDIVQRLRGRYPIGPALPNGEPEFGYREYPGILVKDMDKEDGWSGWSKRPPIMEEAAQEIIKLRGALQEILDMDTWLTHQNNEALSPDSVWDVCRRALEK